jgi:hypothetical protein
MGIVIAYIVIMVARGFQNDCSPALGELLQKFTGGFIPIIINQIVMQFNIVKVQALQRIQKMLQNFRFLMDRTAQQDPFYLLIHLGSPQNNSNINRTPLRFENN